MRNLKRNKETIYYALYSGIEETMKDGLYTGGKTKLYEDVVKAEMGTSPPRTAYGFVSEIARMEFFGLNKPYTKSMWTEDMSCPIAEDTIVWLGLGDIEKYSDHQRYNVGDKAIYEGKVYECTQSVFKANFSPDSWKLVPHNYIVTGIAKSLNVITYALKDVEFR